MPTPSTPPAAHAATAADLATLAVVTTTVGDADQAQQLARAIVQAGHAACVQVLAITSHYPWQGQLHADAEWRLDCKTRPQAVPALLHWLRQHHPYSLPQLLVHPVQASHDYADWMAEQLHAR